ncbi:hypothetical protein HBB16_19635 [Pseudonocardia sp. MCCB 268]|nr:hypothetical protein [Pseudonocardia cytotoxica]
MLNLHDLPDGARGVRRRWSGYDAAAVVTNTTPIGAFRGAGRPEGRRPPWNGSWTSRPRSWTWTSGAPQAQPPGPGVLPVWRMGAVYG